MQLSGEHCGGGQLGMFAALDWGSRESAPPSLMCSFYLVLHISNIKKID